MGVQELIGAFRDNPDGPDDDEVLAELISGTVGIIPDDATVTTGVLQIDPVDAVGGAVRLAYVYLDGLFKYEPTDETTAHDGITCIVLIGGRRYLLVGNIRVKAVDAVGFDTDPTPTEYGQAWIDLTGSIGDANDIIIHTSRGWVAQAPDYGPPLYVKEASTGYPAKSYVHWDEDDGWISGFGPSQYQAASIPLSAEIWDGRVQNQTTNTQPTTIAKGIAHIIGPSPTGTKWAGNAGKLSISEATNDVTVYTPWVGMTVYNIALGYDVKWNGTAWVPSSGVVIESDYDFRASVTSGASTGSGNYSFSATGPSGQARGYDPNGLTITSRRIGQRIEFEWRCSQIAFSTGVDTGANDGPVFGLFRDSETAALDHVLARKGTTQIDTGDRILRFTIITTDATQHTYKVALMHFHPGDGNIYAWNSTAGAALRRYFTYWMYG